jgi:ribonucleoside-triphosphate reductase
LCRSLLSPWKDENGNYKFYGRFNQGVITLNLPDIALSSGGDFDKFWSIFEDRLDLCYRALMVRHNSLRGVKADVAPILWKYGAYARLKSGETIDKLLYGGYSTISLGYAGLYECVKYMTDEDQTEKGGHYFAVKVMKKLADSCEKWKKETNIGFSVYGSPIESTTYKFAKCLQKRFGIIKGITDKEYVTNSYHVTPSQDIDAFTKLTIESEFQKWSQGGAISYVEVPNITKNPDAVLEIMKHIYDTIMYAEINTMTSYCQVCGCTDIKMGDDLKFHCPQCGNDDFDKMNIALRICGYISSNPFNEGRAQDIHDRVYHLDNESFEDNELK